MLFKSYWMVAFSLAMLSRPFALNGQSIVDPCFSSISPLGKYTDSEDLMNLCGCAINFEASDLIEWDGTQWLGALSRHTKRPPPQGCNSRALWIGYDKWTDGGEGFGMRLNKPLEAGRTYSFTFTYARDGVGELDGFAADEFSPFIYTDITYPKLERAYKLGRLPATVDWKTSTITFTAHQSQDGHDWILLHAFDCSGTIMSNCNVQNPIEDVIFPRDSTLCAGDSAILRAPVNPHYRYRWNNGDTTSSITVHSPGSYTVDIYNEECYNSQSVLLEFENCEVQFQMPNIFTPNNDAYNEMFVPMELNYVSSGSMTIYNRWGNKLFSGDFLTGWDGRYKSELVPAGIYFYDIQYLDNYGVTHYVRGTVTVAR